MVALALSHAAYGNGEGCSSSGTTGKGGSSSSQAAMGEGGSPPWMEDGIAMPVSVEDYIFEDNFFMEQHRTNMQSTFDAWLDGMDVEDNVMNDGVQDVAVQMVGEGEFAADIGGIEDGVQDVEIEGVEEVVEMDGEGEFAADIRGIQDVVQDGAEDSVQDVEIQGVEEIVEMDGQEVQVLYGIEYSGSSETSTSAARVQVLYGMEYSGSTVTSTGAKCIEYIFAVDTSTSVS
ncbi:hypothetical protein QYE76_034371 [Lolium multiflorum]|uniref:Uncharacterized protein n=1 Tax=Lolium multiflorum TaxID=4521 RepID=A0AAD8VN94_LOLMU|nr:hypothetical protein QYE76_034371 [Lolium multiflorum]